MKLLPVALCLAAGCASHAVVGVRVDVADAGASVDAAPEGPACGSAVAVQVADGEQFSCALMGGGGVKCWGGNFANQLGDGHPWFNGAPAAHQECHTSIEPGSPWFDCSPRPVDVVGITDATAITASGDVACALHADGLVSCWGGTSTAVPVDVPGVTATSIAANTSGDVCALTATGDVACWRTGAPSVVVSTAVAIAASCALLADGSVSCWDDAFTAAATGFTGATAIADACAQKADGTLWCGPAFTHDAALDGATSWSLGAHDCAVLPTGTWCRGRDDSGEVGNGVNQPTSALAPVCW